MTDYKIYHEDDYSALYEDGLLVLDGDPDYIQEYLAMKLGVTNVYDVDFIDPMAERAYDTLEALENAQNAETAKIVRSPEVAPTPDVYLAGPATNWRQTVGEDLVKAGLQIVYPTGPSISASSSRWEQDHIQRSKVVVIWLPENEDPSTTMYKLGNLASTDKPLIVGCPSTHDSRESLVGLYQITRPGMPVYRTLIEVMDATADMF